ncbi:MAG: hypothetical protein SFV52_03035, partial [Saprospiraceae bacterium]|nr:hypothetical protein [Saprospiraceae bacterium]
MSIRTILLATSTGICCLLTPILVFAQSSNLEVTRCKSIDRGQPIKNLWVDNAGVKWAANPLGVFKIQSCELGQPIPFNAGETSALAFPYGNVDFRWNKTDMDAALGGPQEITAAYFDEAKKQLWIGTRTNGAYVLNTNPKLQVADQFTSKNTKLRSNYITYLGKDSYNRFWVGTEEGVIIGTSGKWKDDLEGYAFQRMRSVNNDVYALADGELWILERGEKWRAININERALEGDPFDFDIAPDGTLWLLSRIVARYDLNTDEFDTYSGTEYYTSEYGRFIGVDADGAAWIATTDKGLFSIQESSAMAVTILTDKPVSCTGNGQDGVLKVRIDGGKAPYQYAWSTTTLVGDAPANVPPGEYSLTVTDANGKTKSAKTTLEDPRITVVVELKKAESAPGAADGRADTRVNGGKSPFRYQWDNSEAAANALKLTEGQHTVTVTDSKGCSTTGAVNISQKLAPLNLELSLASSIPCQGGTTSLVALTTGGKPPFTFNWNNASMQGDRPDNLKAGTYNLTVTDAAGNTARALFTIPEPDRITGTIQVLQPASTGAADGRATVTPQGGSGGFTYQWDTGETTATAAKLGPGTHTVTITDKNGCTGTASFTVTENVLPMSVVLEKADFIKCHAGTTDLKATVNGGKPPYRFKWNKAELTTENPTNLAAGFYELTVTDAKGQTATAGFNLQQPEPMAVTAQAQTPASIGGSDGKATVTASGGNGNFTYKWDNGEASANAARLPAGKHTVTVTDFKGCTATGSVEIPENILPLGVMFAETGAINCAGGTTGLNLTVNGGKGPFQYKWSNPAFQGDKPTNVPAGNYTVTVTDAAGKTLVAPIFVLQPEPIIAAAQVQAPASTGNADGKALASATGGNGNFTFKWDNGETAADAVKLGPGKHTVTATDAKGCTGTASVDITENILPLGIAVAETATITCPGGATSLNATVSGGKGPFKYAWSAPALTGDKPANVPAGNYTVTVTDATGKTATAT